MLFRSWAALTAFVVSGLLINIGRSGQVAFVGAALVLTPVILGRRSRRAAAGGLAAVVVVLVAAYLAVGPFRSRVLGGVRELEAAVVEGRYDSNQGKRVAGAIVALDMVRERPLVGTGVGATMERFRELLDERHPELAPVVSWFPHFHNQYLQTVTETGLVGLASLIGLMVVLALGPSAGDHGRHLGVLLAVSYLLGFLGDPFLRKQLPLVLFATVAGLASAPARPRAASPDGRSPPGAPRPGSASARRRYSSQSSSRLCLVPTPTTRPPLRTKIRDARSIVDSRCAMMKVILSPMTLRRPSWMAASVRLSSALVASSRIRMSGSL